MTITSVVHPPTFIPSLRTVPFHSHVFNFPLSTLSSLTLFIVRFLLNPRLSIDSLEDLEVRAGVLVVGTSKVDRE